MQHRHFKLVADIIRRMGERGFKATTDDIARQFANELCDTNPRFDRARFLAAANGKPLNGRDKVK
jgi:hypothetical protein